MAPTNHENVDSDVAAAPHGSKKTKLLKIIFAVVAAIVVLFVVAVQMQPGQFRVSRSATMSAPPSAVFAQVNDFHNWQTWSPWKKLDPAARESFEGPTAGTGAIFRWSGNSDVGEGSMKITESRPDELIAIQLDFVKPMAGTSTAEFTFKPAGDNQTLVTWSMLGENNFMAKAISLVIDCDKMMGGWFEEGLANIKSVVESPEKR